MISMIYSMMYRYLKNQRNAAMREKFKEEDVLMNSMEEMWTLVCERLNESVGQVIYDIWFKPLKLISFDGTRAEIEASEFMKKIIEQQFLDTVKDAFKSVIGFNVEIIIVSEKAAPKEAPVQKPVQRTEVGFDSVGLEENTFDTFVVGNSNKFAYAAAHSVAAEPDPNAEKPAEKYNPLFIYGDSGLGKTHLLCAICNEIKRWKPDVKIIFTRGEDFVNTIITGINSNNMNAIHDKYRNCDILLVDDIQFIAGKPSTQEEFFHTFDALASEGKQIVLTSDRAAKDIEVLDERLRTRFEWGLIADIQAPDLETRMAIIQRKAKVLGIALPDDVVQFVAENVKTNIRQLEGAVKKINALVTLEGSQINVAMAQRAIKDIISDSRPVSVVVDKIISETSRTFGVTQSDIISKKKDAKTAKARQVAIYIVREVTGLTQKQISEFFGGRDRTTILYSVDSIAESVKKDSSLKKTIENIIKNAREQ